MCASVRQVLAYDINYGGKDNGKIKNAIFRSL